MIIALFNLIGAIIMMVLNEIALEPMAEFKKFTASLLTPTIKSAMANRAKAINIYRYMFSMDQNFDVNKYHLILPFKC